ncbi:hypothetical protein ACXO3P_06650 [Lactobacillus delbrueckii subsp. bulgaricus]
MTKTERYMWLANDLLLTAAAVSLIINLVGQTASGYAFSGSHGQATELLYDAFILLVAAAALGSKWLAPAAAWVIIDRVVGLYFGLTWYWTLAVVALWRSVWFWPATAGGGRQSLTIGWPASSWQSAWSVA